MFHLSVLRKLIPGDEFVVNGVVALPAIETVVDVACVTLFTVTVKLLDAPVGKSRKFKIIFESVLVSGNAGQLAPAVEPIK